MFASDQENRDANEVLEDILTEVINLDEGAARFAEDTVEDFLKTLLSAMRKVESTFDKIFVEVFRAGSFYDELKIFEPNEFDLNFVLKQDGFQVLDRQCAIGKEAGVIPGHALYRSCSSNCGFIAERYYDWSEFEALCSYRNGLSLLTPLRIMSNFQGVVDKALYYLRSGKLSHLTITTTSSGPARTICVKRGELTFDIDIVPVFRFYSTNVESNVYLVPKPPPQDELQWRLSYAEKERQILHNNSCAKKVIKLLKRLRDIQGAPCHKLCSYHLKNLVLLEIDNYTWDDKELAKIFMDVLKKLCGYLKDKEIPWFLDKNCKILSTQTSTLNEKTLENMHGRFTAIFQDIAKNPPMYMRKYFIGNQQRRNFNIPRVLPDHGFTSESALTYFEGHWGLQSAVISTDRYPSP